MRLLPHLWWNGAVRHKRAARIFPYNQGLNYGASIYEAIRVATTERGPVLFRLHEHVERFFRSADELAMTLPLSRARFIAACRAVVRKNDVREGTIRPMAWYADPVAGINVLESSIDQAITAWWYSPREGLAPLRLTISRVVRNHTLAVRFGAKIGGQYGNNLFGYIEARKAGYDGPLFLDAKGRLTESAAANLFLVRGRTLMTPREGSILPGMTRATILAIARDLGLRARVTDLTPNDLRNADEVFLSGSGRGVYVVRSVRGWYRSTSDSPHATRLRGYLHDIVRGRVPRYRSWLTQC